jgi:hypothetical protein
MIAAPASSIAAPCAWAASGSSRNWPPSEKLSGVTFRMPMICGWSSRIVRDPQANGAWTLRKAAHCASPCAASGCGRPASVLGRSGTATRSRETTLPASRTMIANRLAQTIEPPSRTASPCSLCGPSAKAIGRR